MLNAATHSATPSISHVPVTPEPSAHAAGQFDLFKVVRRNGSVVIFEPAKISVALTKAFIAVNGGFNKPRTPLDISVTLCGKALEKVK